MSSIFGTETGRREKEKETLYGCFKGEELIWPAGGGCKGPLGTCPIYEKIKILIKKYDC